MDDKDLVILRLRKDKAEILMALYQVQYREVKRELDNEILPALAEGEKK